MFRRLSGRFSHRPRTELGRGRRCVRLEALEARRLLAASGQSTTADPAFANSTAALITIANASTTPPILLLGDLNYSEGDNGGNPVQINPSGTLLDYDGDSDWDGGTLTVQITGNAEAADEVSIPDNVSGGINTNGSELRNNLTVIGSLNAAEGLVTGGSQLQITFNSNATNLLALQTLRAISYRTTSDAPSTLEREITFSATDRHGGNATNRSTVFVTATNDPATISFANVISLPEDTDTTNDVKVADVVIQDPDGGVNNLTIGGGPDDADFVLVGTELFLAANTLLDFETQMSYSTVISVDDPTIAGFPDDSQPFTLSILNVANLPPIADAGGPYSVFEGNNLVLSAAGSSDPDLDPLTYRWDVDGDGDFDENITGATPMVTWAQLVMLGIDDGDVPAALPQTITVEVSDGNDVDTATSSLTVTNTQPTTGLQFFPVPGPEGGASNLKIVGVTDPGDDTITAYSVNWGDGNVDHFTVAADGSPEAKMLTHVYDDGPNSYLIVVSFTDEDGTFNSGFLSVSGPGGQPGVVNVVPDAAVSGPADAMKGESVAFDLSATDVSSADQAADFTWRIDWDGDGDIDLAVTGTSPQSVDHVFNIAGSTTVIVTATDKDGGESGQAATTIEIIQPVSLDIKPGNDRNRVNGKSQGVIPVVMYTTSDFDVASVDASTIRLEGVAARSFAFDDVDGDGDQDLILHFAVQEVLAAIGGTGDSGDEVTVDAKLTAETVDSVFLEGTDALTFFFPGNGKGAKK